MNHNSIEIALNNSPTIKMLRSKNAALIVGFLYSRFHLKSEIAIANSTLVIHLAEYIDELNYQDLEEEQSLNNLYFDSVDKAKKYIEKWTEENYIRNYVDETTKQVMNVLTKHTMKAFQILELLKDKELIGTESKFKDIFNKLRELIDNSTEDPTKKIEELEKRKDEIDAEIRKIKRDGFVKTFENYQIKTRFDDIAKLSNELIGDFKEVEDNFKNIIRDIYEKQINKANSKGKILQFTFDSLNELKQSEQGKSFYTFWNFLIDDSSKEEFLSLTIDVYKILEERDIEYNDKILRKLKSILYFSAQKVLETNNVLADKLSRIIAEKEIQNRKEAMETINEIKTIAFKLVEKNTNPSATITIETEAAVNMPLERKITLEETVVNEYTDKPKTARNIIDFDALISLADSTFISDEQLLRNIELLLNEKQQITLSEVLETFPVAKGLAEVLKYISLVPKNSKFFINKNKYEYLLFDFENEKYLYAPQIVYSK